MPVISQSELLDIYKSTKGRLLALDLGRKTIGLALSDETQMIASPFKTLERKGTAKDIEVLHKIMQEHKITAVILGLPIQMDGSEGPMCDFVKEFGNKLELNNPIPICYWDERLSSIAVERVLLDADMSRKRRKEVIDKLAASYILQGALDWLRNRS